MGLLALPNELLLLVTPALSTRDLASLILTARRLHTHLTPVLTARARKDYRSLHHAVAHGHHDVLQHYLSLGVPASIADRRKKTALHEAVGRGDEAAVRLLLDHGAAPGAAARVWRQTPLLRAVAGRSEEIVRMLLESGADPNAVGPRRILPINALYVSRARGRRGEGWEGRVAAMLVQYGARRNVSRG